MPAAEAGSQYEATHWLMLLLLLLLLYSKTHLSTLEVRPVLAAMRDVPRWVEVCCQYFTI